MNDGSLSRRELALLGALERSLLDDDPAFVLRFDLDARALDDPPGKGGSGVVLRWLRRRRNRDRPE